MNNLGYACINMTLGKKGILTIIILSIIGIVVSGVFSYLITINILKDIGLLDLYLDIRENKKIEDIDFLWNKMINNKISTENLSMDSENHFKKLDEFLQ